MNMSDMARQMAAGGDTAMSAPDDVMAEEGDPGMPQPTGPVPMEEIEAALGQLEGALEGLPPDTQTQIRTHLDAIREVVGQAEASGEGTDSTATEPPAPADQETGAMGGLTEQLGGL